MDQGFCKILIIKNIQENTFFSYIFNEVGDSGKSYLVKVMFL